MIFSEDQNIKLREKTVAIHFGSLERDSEI